MANIKKSYINDSGTLVQEMDDGSQKRFGAAGNVVDVDSSGKVLSNVEGSHTFGSDLTKKETFLQFFLSGAKFQFGKIFEFNRLFKSLSPSKR